MSKIKCDENCAECGKYTTIHSNGEITTYDCLFSGKTVTKEQKGER